MPSLSPDELRQLRHPEDMVWGWSDYAEFLEATEDNRLFLPPVDGGLGYLWSEPLSFGDTFPTFRVFRTEAGQRAYEELSK